MVTRRGRPDDPGAACPADLGGERADTAGRAVHEQRLTLPDTQGTHHGPVGGEAGEGQSGGLGEAHGAGLVHRRADIGRHQLGQSAVRALHVAAEVPDDLVTGG